MSKGYLIVFEGIDGSGKTTQIEFLSQYLATQGQALRAWGVKVISFPQYGQNEYADRISDYLSGKLGKLSDIDPYEMAKLYASDRKTVRDLIKGWLKSGKLVISNRYISSNKAHQGANLPKEKRAEFFKWLDELEYQTNGMPKPDLTILLKVDPKAGQENSQKDHKVDIHEKSLEHEQKATQIYLELSKKEKNWTVVNCMKDGKMKPKEEIYQQILRILHGQVFGN